MRFLKSLPIVGFTFLLLAGGCTVVPTTTYSSPAPTPAISQDKAIAIAATQLPLQVVERATVQIDDVNGWRVKFLGTDTTKQELNWPEDGRNRFDLGFPVAYRMAHSLTSESSSTHRPAISILESPPTGSFWAYPLQFGSMPILPTSSTRDPGL